MGLRLSGASAELREVCSHVTSSISDSVEEPGGQNLQTANKLAIVSDKIDRRKRMTTDQDKKNRFNKQKLKAGIASCGNIKIIRFKNRSENI